MHVSKENHVRILLSASRRVAVCASLLLLAGCEESSSQPPASNSDPSMSPGEVRQRIDDVLLYTYRHRHLNLQDHAAWQILHGALTYGRDFQVRNEDGRLVSAVDHILAGGQMQGWTVEPGDVDAATGRRGMRTAMDAGSKTGQGHPDQWLAVLAQCGLDPRQTIDAEGHQYTVTDWVNQTEWDVPRNHAREFSWTLIGLTIYRPTTHSWTASDGETWTIERLVQSEVEQGLDGAACGGSHRLIGMAMALNRHLADGHEATGVWQDADAMIQGAIATAREHQNPDGSFSSNYFLRPGTSTDLAVNLGATGHTLEFLTIAMTGEQLSEPWVERAVLHLCDLFDKTKDVPLECGALYHAAHGLLLYRERMFGPIDYSRES